MIDNQQNTTQILNETTVQSVLRRVTFSTDQKHNVRCYICVNAMASSVPTFKIHIYEDPFGWNVDFLSENRCVYELKHRQLRIISLSCSIMDGVTEIWLADYKHKVTTFTFNIPVTVRDIHSIQQLCSPSSGQSMSQSSCINKPCQIWRVCSLRQHSAERATVNVRIQK